MTDPIEETTSASSNLDVPEVPVFLQNPVAPTQETPQPDPVPDPQAEVDTQIMAAEVEEHPAVSIISQIETHLTSLSLYGSVENEIRKLISDLKTFF